MTTCTNCAHWSLKTAGAMSRQGFGHCVHLPRYQFVSLGCERIKPADAAVVAARVAWLKKLEVSDERS